MKQAEPPAPQVDRIVLADSIVQLSEGVARLLASGINRRAVEVLLWDRTKVSKRDIALVLDAIGTLKRDYCS